MNKVKENLKAGKTVVGVAGAPNDVTMPLLAESAYDFILFDERYLSGHLKIDLTAIVDSYGKGDLNTTIDLKEAQISIPGIEWNKSTMVASKMTISAIFSKQGIENIRSLTLGGRLSLIHISEPTRPY